MTNIFSEEMSGFVNIFQLFSLFPYSPNVILNIFLKFYSALNLLFIVLLFISAFLINHVLEDTESLSLLVGGLVFVGLLITHFLNLLQAFASRNEQLMIYQKFDEIDFLLQNQLLVNIKYDRLRKRLYIKYFIIAAMILAIHTTSIVSVTVNGLFFRYYLHLILPIAIIRIRCIQNMFYVDLIKEKLNLVNQKLDDIVKKNRDKMAFIIFADKLQKFEKKDAKTTLYEQLMTLKQIYGKIWDVSNLINDCFGWSLLAIVQCLKVHVKFDFN